MDAHRNAHVHQSMQKGCTHQFVGQITSGHSCAWRALSNEHHFAWSLMHSWHGSCRTAGSPQNQNHLNAGSAQRCGNVSTRQEPCASPVPLLISGTWNCLSARQLLFFLSSAQVHSKGNAGELHLNWIKSLCPAILQS